MLVEMKINPKEKESFVILNTKDLKYILDAIISIGNCEIVIDSFGNVIKTYVIEKETNTTLTLFITSDGTISGCSFN